MANFHHGINHWIILGIIATPNLTDSAVGESNLASLSGDCVITSFPHHEVVKLTEETSASEVFPFYRWFAGFEFISLSL